MPGPLAVAGALAGAEFLKFLFNRNSTDNAADKQFAALDKAQGAIQGGADKAVALQQPYLENAGNDFRQLRGLVQSGFFQQPYGKSFQSQQYSPAGFSFDPSQGSASFAPWQPQGGPAGFSPQALPTLPAFQPPAQPQPQQMARAPMPMPQMGPAQSQQGINSVTSNTLGLGASLPNKNMGQNPYLNALQPPGTNPNTAPLGVRELLALGLLGRPGSGPFQPGGLMGGR